VPEVVRTFDGRWRMYYVAGRDTIANVIASAISDDGLNFVREEGIRVEGMVDPAVVKLSNGQYWLFGMVGLGKPGSQLEIRSATSADGMRPLGMTSALSADV
jgi:GH43 family beta-xylosidase